MGSDYYYYFCILVMVVLTIALLASIFLVTSLFTHADAPTSRHANSNALIVLFFLSFFLCKGAMDLV